MATNVKQIARLRYLRIAPRKVRLVGALVTGLRVDEAEAQLMHERRRPAKPLLKLLRSAVADAKDSKKKLEPDRLYVESVRVDGGPMLKRFLPRARGMATPIHKKMSHVTLVLAELPTAAAPKFKIVVKKKTKLPPGERKSAKKEKTVAEERETRRRDRRPGFFRRMFSRKSV
jgi:large subunit ribosomal protein L22